MSFSSYGDTLIAANAALEEQGIEIRHFLLDSWWYGEGWNGGAAYWEDTPKCTGNDTSAEGKCKKNAQGRLECEGVFPADSFPMTLKAFHRTIGVNKTIWVHNGVWVASSPYRKQFPFTQGEAAGPPQVHTHTHTRLSAVHCVQ